MKRYLVAGAIFAIIAVTLLLWPHHGGNASAPGVSEPTPGPTVSANSNKESEADLPAPGRVVRNAGSNTPAAGKDPVQLEIALRSYNQSYDTPVAFYGLVVDQDSHPLPDVTVDVRVRNQYETPSFTMAGTTTRLQRQTGPDGHFEVSGLKGNFITVEALTKDSYEPELEMHGNCGTFGPQGTSLEKPAVFRLWSTNIPHEKLITGRKSSAVIPDGRPYSVNLTNAAIAEGTEGDLVIWIKRPASVGFVGGFAWSCELTAPGGLLEENSDWAMFTAPDTGYTNVFAYQEEANVDGWSASLYGKRFYIRLREGQIYGRITLNFIASPSRDGPALISLEYAINPSGSRLLR